MSPTLAERVILKCIRTFSHRAFLFLFSDVIASALPLMPRHGSV